MASLADFMGLVGPSESRYPRLGWGEVEDALGVVLPTDYKAWGSEYVSLHVDRFLAIDNFATPVYFERDFSETVASGLVSVRRSMERSGRMYLIDDQDQVVGEDLAALPVYPEPGGLLMWGSSTYTGSFMWLMDGDDPDEWPIVVTNRDSEWWQFDGGFLDFLVGVLRGDVRCPMIKPEWLKAPAIEELVGTKLFTHLGGKQSTVMDVRPTSRWVSYFETS
ncbi:hypothetical protein FB566_4637 [Stackebrandtia endophytica]|uniref:SUKH superfamily protein n=1 Tax=Stackebrandtia endophytica TaxID=1496996 RepID=A0A543B2L1_9ACTN|nr:hypothetical protein [Stackebrandtia endophytica]TQL79036.1 hypothetical protein FB566_4637 [Stackebrandtia endophytica]